MMNEQYLWKSGVNTFLILLGLMNQKLEEGSAESHMEVLDRVILIEEFAENLIDLASEMRRQVDSTMVEFSEAVQADLDSLPMMEEVDGL